MILHGTCVRFFSCLVFATKLCMSCKQRNVSYIHKGESCDKNTLVFFQNKGYHEEFQIIKTNCETNFQLAQHLRYKKNIYSLVSSVSGVVFKVFHINTQFVIATACDSVKFFKTYFGKTDVSATSNLNFNSERNNVNALLFKVISKKQWRSEVKFRPGPTIKVPLFPLFKFC